MARQIFLFFFFAGLIIVALMFIVPVKQSVKKEVFIHLPVKKVYDYLNQLNHFHEWAIWSKSDSLIKTNVKGVDGTVGVVSEWSGHKDISGEGSIELLSTVENKEIQQKINFISPASFSANSHFLLEEQGAGTKLTWTFSISTPRPKNIFNLFSNLEKSMGDGFDESLKTLKTILEINAGLPVPKEYKVYQYNFPETHYIYSRNQISEKEISTYRNQQFEILQSIVKEKKEIPGTSALLFYEKDETANRIDVAAGVTLSKSIHFDNRSILTLPAAKVIYVDYYGAYSYMTDAYEALNKHLLQNGWSKKEPVIEQYMNDHSVIKDTAYWHTRIIYFVH